jgi:hypothetical protein
MWGGLVSGDRASGGLDLLPVCTGEDQPTEEIVDWVTPGLPEVTSLCMRVDAKLLQLSTTFEACHAAKRSATLLETFPPCASYAVAPSSHGVVCAQHKGWVVSLG